MAKPGANLLTLLALALCACSENGLPPEPAGAPVFPEIEDMVLVAPDSAIQGNFNDPEAIFFIDRFEVTNAEYAEFRERSGYRPQDPEAFLSHWEGGAFQQGMEDLPVIFVSFHDAVQYAAHASKSLPYLDQWLRAALGNASSKNFPWGRDFDLFYCNTLRARIHAPSRVGTFENGKSEWGCYDMIGNVAEWTRTSVPGNVYPSYYVMGGSWNEGGTAVKELYNFSLVPEIRRQAKNPTLFPHQLPGSRNNQLGFRCVRNDAVSFIREALTARIAALPAERRSSAFDELALMSGPLYSVLKLLEFETLSRNISAPPATAMVRLVPSPEPAGLPGLLLCRSNGFMGMYALNGARRWRYVEPREEDEYETAFGYTVIDEPASIIMQSKWEPRCFLRAVDPVDGSHRWGGRGPGEVWHIEPLGNELLVDWHTDDRLRDFVPWYLADPIDLRQWIAFHAEALLTREALFSELRNRRLAFFAGDREVDAIQDDSLFEVTRFHGMPHDWAETFRRRYRIQLFDGEYNNTEVRPAPGSTLMLHEMNSGRVKWSQDFPGALFGFQGQEELDPLVVTGSGHVAVALMNTRNARVFVAQLSLDDGSLQHGYDLADLGTELTSWVALRASAFMGIMDAEKLLTFDALERTVTARSIGDLLGGVEQVVVVESDGRTRNMESRNGLFRGSRWALSDLFLTGPATDPWLLARSGSRDRCLLFCGWNGSGFSKVIHLEGTYNRYRRLASGENVHVLVWDNVGNLLCFDGIRRELLWKRNVGYITDTEIALSDLDGDGNHEAMIATLSGEILVIELDTGDTTHYFRRTGSTFSYLAPVGTEQSRRQEVFCWIKDQGIFILDTDREPATDAERNLLLTVEEMERWRAGSSGS